MAGVLAVYEVRPDNHARPTAFLIATAAGAEAYGRHHFGHEAYQVMLMVDLENQDVFLGHDGPRVCELEGEVVIRLFQSQLTLPAANQS